MTSVKMSRRNNAIFFKTTINFQEKKQRFLHVVPNFSRTPSSYDYEIFGTDETRIECTITNTKNSQKIISFASQLGETYFIKILAKYEKSIEEFFLFYKMEDDFDEEETEDTEEIDGNEPEEPELDDDADNQEIERRIREAEECEENKITRYIARTGINTGLDFEENIDFDSL